MQITTIGVDLAKHVFQLHGVGSDGRVVLRQKLRRSQMTAFFAQLSPCLVAMEACATAHHWGRELAALGHEVRLMPAHYVKAYVKRGKNDAADAEAICEAVGRPTMRFVALEKRVAEVDAEIRAWHRANPVSQRLAKIPGVGPLIASAIVATVADASTFRSGREFAAWLGLVPRQRSTGGKQRLGRITHQGDAYIRRLLIIGAQSALQRSKEIRQNAWVQGLLGRCPRLKVAVALANKTARIAWVLMAKGDFYRPAAIPAA